MSVQDIQAYYRTANSAREYYNRVTNKQEEKETARCRGRSSKKM